MRDVIHITLLMIFLLLQLAPIDVGNGAMAEILPASAHRAMLDTTMKPLKQDKLLGQRGDEVLMVKSPCDQPAQPCHDVSKQCQMDCCMMMVTTAMQPLGSHAPQSLCKKERILLGVMPAYESRPPIA